MSAYACPGRDSVAGAPCVGGFSKTPDGRALCVFCKGAMEAAPTREGPAPLWLLKVRAMDRRRGHAFLPVETLRALPALCSQDGKGLDAVAHVRYFAGGACVWYITELDPNTGEAFGWCDLGMGGGELGYVSLAELGGAAYEVRLQNARNGNVHRMSMPVERDCHWEPRALRECKEVATHG